ncbi:unnamed protein product [Rotaria magnacalcarata]|nr:unnamed protein product [Rotaria magnacalcarata]CAF3941169.1 unnamed protein product [Rotaria magnacalcarata]CAF4170815.1 unnamed protein product [Rotaria magnacalcarata]
MGAKARCPVPNGNVSNNDNPVDLKYLLQDGNCIHSVPIEAQYFTADDYELFKDWSLYLCSYESVEQSTELDSTFNTLVDNTMDAKTLVEELVEHHSMKAYIVDSLKRYHSLLDIIHILPTCAELELTIFGEQHQAKIENFLNIIQTITKAVLLTATIDSISYESQRYFGNFIKKNDLPLPFAYYTWNKQRNLVEYKINFQTLAEVMCLTTGRYILQIGSESATKMGKTSMLQYIFPDKRAEALNTDGSPTLRNGCIDVLFPSDTVNQRNESYVIFDVHGTINALNEDIITSIQENCALQIFYVTKQDLETTFLNSMMNYSRNIQEKPTIVVIFDPNYDDICNQRGKVIDAFKSQYQNWKCLAWTTAPPATVWYQMDYNKKNKDLRRSLKLFKSFNSITESINAKTKQLRCTSIFSIQSYYLSVKTLKNYGPPANPPLKIQSHLDELFNKLNDKTENLRIAAPISYLTSEIKQCERELLDNWDSSQVETQSRKHDLDQKLSNTISINRYTGFFIDLFTKYSFIEILITEKYLEKWRSQFDSTLHEQLMKAKTETLKFNSIIKQLEEQLSSTEKLNEVDKTKMQRALDDVRSKFKQQQKHITEIYKKLINVDLTIGLFCDEIMALYERLPNLFNSEDLIRPIAKTLANLMLKGFAIHILRGRPLYCQSKLIEKIIQFIQTTQKPPLVLTVLGEQSSAKSSLMNTTFGCNFRVSAGRCTIGMYMSVIRWRSETIVIFDTEGLLSLEEADSIFDNQMVTMGVLSSHLVLINHKGEFSSNLKDLIGMSFYAKLQIQSPIKPKLLFVLRDQVDLTSKTVFFRQLTELKEQLHNDSKFLKNSIDEELDINNENVCLLPNAFSHDEHAISNIGQCWRNQLFSREITSLRNTIFENITSTTKPQRFLFNKSISTTITTNAIDRSYPQTPTNDPAYTDLAQLYTKVSRNWEVIDRLGPKLLECKTLYELSIMNDLQAIANDIIQTINVDVVRDGENLIDKTLFSMSNNHFIDKDRDRIVEQFNNQLNQTINCAISTAKALFSSKTERSCFLPEMKLKVDKSMEPPIRSVQYLLKEIFEERLTKLLGKARVDDAKQQLLKYVQNEFNQHKILQSDDFRNRLDTSFRSIIEKYEKELQSSCETETIIIDKILKFYNSQLQCRRETNRESVYHYLSRITDWEPCNRFLKNLNNCMSNAGKRANHQPARKSGGFLEILKSFSAKPSNEYIDCLWKQLKKDLKWFSNDRNEKKNKKIFTDISSVVLPNFEDDLDKLIKRSKCFSSDPKTIQYLFQFIENAMNEQAITNNSRHLDKPSLCSDLATIGLNIVIKQAIATEKSNYESCLKNSTNEIKECKENLFRQYNAMKDAYELGQALADTIGKQIINEISRLLKRRISSEMTEDIAKHQFINHEAIQKQAYEESISQANGENILKYVYDINRYFIELSLREIKTTLNAVAHKHILNFEHLIISAINKANEFVKQGNHEDTGTLRDDIRNKLLSLSDLTSIDSPYAKSFETFSLHDIVSIPIKDSERFKQGFSRICDFYKDIRNRVANLTRNMKAEAFKSCKQAIARKLGCQARCPGCGAKCSKLEPHENEEVECWQDPCKKCQRDKCICERSKSVSVITHEASHHVAGAFHGWKCHKSNTPALNLCYQDWKTRGVAVKKTDQPNDSENNNDDDEWEIIFPKAKYFNTNHPAWYNNLNKLSMEGSASQESIPPPEQRRAWMAAHCVLVNHYKPSMTDFKEYDTKLYPLKVDTLPTDFEPVWHDENFE